MENPMGAFSSPRWLLGGADLKRRESFPECPTDPAWLAPLRYSPGVRARYAIGSNAPRSFNGATTNDCLIGLKQDMPIFVLLNSFRREQQLSVNSHAGGVSSLAV